MRRTIYLPDELGERVEEYLRDHPDRSLSSLVQAALAEQLAPTDPQGILELAGLVPTASTPAREHAEDRHMRRER
jgi:hypothetical protein